MLSIQKHRIFDTYHKTLIRKRYASQSSIGIRREDKSRWERRAALTPSSVKRLIEETGAQVYVQPSTKRIFSIESYEKAGAIISEDISKADIILGIKEVPEAALIDGKTYLFFSHTHKGNEKNMPMLQSIIDKNIRLIDYELMKDATGRRLVAFGKFAGNAGMVDIFHGMGQRFLGMGYSSPFMYMPMAHTFPTIAEAKAAIARMGNIIRENGTAKDFGPLVYAFTGSGNVAQGAMEMFKETPHEFVPAEDLPKLMNDKNPNLNKLYATQLEVTDYMVHKDSKEALTCQEEYFSQPNNYMSNFQHKIAPYVNCVITGAYWDKRYPRTLTNQQLLEIERMKQKGLMNKGKMMSLADIVCDIRGAFECLSHCTNVDDGFYYYDAIKDMEHKNAEGDGIQIMGIDILPAEFPIESSEYFSTALYPFIKEMVMKPPKAALSQLSPLLQKAAITESGSLTKDHMDLKSKLPGLKSTPKITKNSKKTVLLLGSGMVAAPLVDYLAKRPDVHIIVASNRMSEANTLTTAYSNAESALLTIEDNDSLLRLVSKADVVVSLVPAFLHTKVAHACIEQRKDMVTASYVSKEMEELETKAQKAGILMMNEVGLDPGIDHMSAMKIIDEAKNKGSKIRSFISWCGGLPSPEASNVPLGYKFSWSPRGVLTASGNDAIYWSNGEEKRIAGADLLKNHFPLVQTPYAGFVFEGLANRNSLGYADIYGLGDVTKMDTMFRGTLRYQGYSDLLYAFRKLGFLDLSHPTDISSCGTWMNYFDHVITHGSSFLTAEERQDRVTNRLGLPREHPMSEKLWASIAYLFDTNEELTAAQGDTALDLFSKLLAKRLKYNEGEKDMVAMHHEFEIEHRSGKKEKLTSTLMRYGDDKYTAMAKTVGLPAAMAVELILDNRIPERGIQRPTQPHVYLPILDQLEMHGIKFVESSQPFHSVKLDACGSNTW
ncbi:Saccharopine dehydrogenase-domain-containing protein [Mycotypha africana]|uniref:Saccharopine dehydrogenase-domain-containing protein n=1 Tax=Mycotypha africana TaxID=64632 RepID=UPI002301A543|nr:Saccharopine dehydrogenase-domain-containing protein [Mycotypha africana]KAI8972025.1 Saccharopine dehydrogenase-domain-containing protein [Mycotypha africana]